MAGRRETPGINAGSMADIAFLLLIFFLVTTTMNNDRGISRMLPPKSDEIIENPPPVRDRNIFIVMVNANNDLLVEEEPMSIDMLKDATKEFVMNPNKLANLSENPTKAVVSLRNNRLTSYNMYISVQDQLTQAYMELRNVMSQQQFAKNYEDLPKVDAKVIRKAIPMNISEAEPVKGE